MGFGLDIEVIPYDENRIVETILNISKGGIGLIWDRDETALGIYMAAGIPVIVKRGLSCEDYVLSHNIGMVISEFSEIYGLVSLLDEDSISIYYENVKKTRKLFIEGVYTQKLLIDAYILAQEL